MPQKKHTATKKDQDNSPEQRLRKIIRAEIAKILFTLFQKRKMWMG
jgi:hypothetical protein